MTLFGSLSVTSKKKFLGDPMGKDKLLIVITLASNLHHGQIKTKNYVEQTVEARVSKFLYFRREVH